MHILNSKRNQRKTAICLLVVFSLQMSFACSIVSAEEKNPEASAAAMMNAKTEEAIAKGLAYLASRLNEDGSMGRARRDSRIVAVTSLTGMAFLSAGSTPGRGPYGKEVDRCIEYVLANTKESGFITSRQQSHGPMYSHGFATLFLAEVYGMSGRRDLREKLTKAVSIIINSQNNEGGWRYEPVARDADISVTVCQVMALRAARNAGIDVPAETIDRAIEYVKRCQNQDGGFKYRTEEGLSLFPRSAAGVVALYSAGIYKGQELERGLKFLDQHVPNKKRFNQELHFFYGHYYGVQAMWHSGGKRWERWYPAIRDALIARQSSVGKWQDSNSAEYGTAMACIILQMPNNCLPIFQR